MNDHDLLIEAVTMLRDLKVHFSNHIKHHWAITIPLLMAIVGLIIVLITK
jgi:hypothetical protein